MAIKAQPAVLVVEDEAILRFDAVDALTQSGMDVSEAANAAEALTILKARPDISIMFTDINMAGHMDGLGLVREVKKRWPHIRIVVTSGQVKMRDADLPGGARFIAKPYSISHLQTVMGQA